MNVFVIGVIVFVVFSGVMGLLMVQAIQRARAEGLEGSALMMRLLPYLIGDVLLVGLFVAWLLAG